MNTIIYFHAVPTKAFKHGVHTCHHREKGMVCTIIRGKVNVFFITNQINSQFFSKKC